ncbi:MAG TPA: pyrroloquinoline quinone biosynthesis protein PqqB [Candidatus Acidoferrales bacterium]|nr:pyrroloquinoline quinone biosynthesis protein PqqB [Candidatus Acidoferrales bacterium]
MRVKILGSAAGGGFPQWNCSCHNCAGLRAGTLKSSPRTQTQVIFSADGSSWYLLNASPDLREQITHSPELAPKGHPRGTPIAGIILTCADVDCVAGLLHLREFQPFTVFSMPSVRRVLTEENSLFRTLERSHPPVRWESLAFDAPLSLLGGRKPIRCTAVALHGEYPDYVGETLRQSLPPEEAVIGILLTAEGKKLFYAPTLSGHSGPWKECVAASDLALLDGTFWSDDELLSIEGAGKTARQMGHLPLGGTGGLLQELTGDCRGRRVLVHLNNTNPILDEESIANRAVREAGWEVAYDGMEFML